MNPWRCAFCSQECKRMAVPGHLIYAIELSNETGKYGEAISNPIEGDTTQYSFQVRQRTPKTDNIISPICRTCNDVCESLDTIEDFGLKSKITEYWITVRTEEIKKKIESNRTGGTSTI